MKTKCPECGHRYSGYHGKGACLLYKNTRRENKYGAVASDGFPSQLERATHMVLLMREKAGEIRNLKRYATVHLPFGVTWKIDFSFEDAATGELRYAEAKGKWTADAGIKLKMYRHVGPAPLEIWQQGRGGPVLVETIVPKEREGEK